MTVRSVSADEAAVGDGDLEDIGGEGGEGGVAVVIGLTVDIPRDGPDLGIDVLQQSGVAHVFFEDGAGDGGEGFDGDKEVGAGGHARSCGPRRGHRQGRWSGCAGGTGVAGPRYAGPR